MASVQTTPSSNFRPYLRSCLFKKLNLGVQLLTKSKWNHYNLDRLMDFIKESSGNAENHMEHRKAITCTFRHLRTSTLEKKLSKNFPTMCERNEGSCQDTSS